MQCNAMWMQRSGKNQIHMNQVEMKWDKLDMKSCGNEMWPTGYGSWMKRDQHGYYGSRINEKRWCWIDTGHGKMKWHQPDTGQRNVTNWIQVNEMWWIEMWLTGFGLSRKEMETKWKNRKEMWWIEMRPTGYGSNRNKSRPNEYGLWRKMKTGQHGCVVCMCERVSCGCAVKEMKRVGLTWGKGTV